MKKIRWRRINNIIHRDLGYLFVGMTIIYGLSGIALNHIDDWNPSYIIKNKEVAVETSDYSGRLSEAQAIALLAEYGYDEDYKSHYYPSGKQLKIFFDGGTMDVNMTTGNGRLETMKRRPVFHSVNFMHYNPGKLWTWYSDIYAGALILLAITGLFVLRGRKGIKGRGAVLGLIGIIIPLILIFLYL